MYALDEPDAPVKPTPSDINPHADSVSRLSDIEVKDFNYRYEDWLRELRKTDKEKEQQMQFRTLMLTTIEEYLAEQVTDMDTCSEIYEYLRKRCAPSSENRQIETRQKYQKMCEGPKSQNFEKWIDQWRVWYNKAERLNLTDETTAKQDFANALTSFDESMSDNLAFGKFDNVDDMISVAIKRVRDKGARQKG